MNEFLRFLDIVGRDCEFVTVSEMVGRLATAPTPERPLAAITVDDGYADFHEFALPILVDRQVPATVYVTGGFAAGQCWLWWDALRFLINQVQAEWLSLDLDEQRFHHKIRTSTERKLAWSQLANTLLYRNDLRSIVLDQLAGLAGAPLPASPPATVAPMSWSQLREVQAAGVEIGAHSMTHAHLPGLGFDALDLEVRGGKSILTEQLDAPIRTFAYPNGMPNDYSPAVEDAVKNAGFESAVLAYPRPFKPSDCFRIGRWSASSHDGRLGHIVNGASSLKLAWNSA